jgi:hypothetical protein
VESPLRATIGWAGSLCGRSVFVLLLCCFPDLTVVDLCTQVAKHASWSNRSTAWQVKRSSLPA